MTRSVACAAILAGLLGMPSGLHGQTTQRFVNIVRLAQDGMVDSARAEMGRVLKEFPPSDSLYPEALYTSAIVAATDGERRHALRTVIVEYSRSSWADDALLLMAQLEYADANPAGTIRQITRLLDDYPLSALRSVAAFWGARAANDVRNGELACRWVEVGLGARSDDVELRAQLEFQMQRCQATLAQRAESTAVRPPTDAAQPRPTETPPASGVFVQVAALDTEAAAAPIADRMRSMNYPVVVVREDPWFKVRVGPFANRADAEAARRRIRDAFGGRPFLVTVR